MVIQPARMDKHESFVDTLGVAYADMYTGISPTTHEHGGCTEEIMTNGVTGT